MGRSFARSMAWPVTHVRLLDNRPYALANDRVCYSKASAEAELSLLRPCRFGRIGFCCRSCWPIAGAGIRASELGQLPRILIHGRTWRSAAFHAQGEKMRPRWLVAAQRGGDGAELPDQHAPEADRSHSRAALGFSVMQADYDVTMFWSPAAVACGAEGAGGHAGTRRF